YYIVVHYSWGWGKWKAGALLALFLSFDIPFLVANLFKFFEGGYVPMLIGAALIARMLIWSHGRTSLLDAHASRYATFDKARPHTSPYQKWRHCLLFQGRRHGPI